MVYSNIPSTSTGVKRQRRRRVSIGLVTVLLPLSAAISGCGSTGGPVGALAQDKQILASCPANRQVAARGAIDLSARMRSVATDSGRLDPIRELVQFTIVCGGHLRIDGFGGSSAATAAIYDGDVSLPGSTENARLRREPAKTGEVMALMVRNLPAAADKVASDDSDPVAQLGMDAEYLRQLDPGGNRYVLRSVISTDGIEQGQVSLADPALTAEKATQLANQVEVPNLTGADIRFTDIGKTPSMTLPTTYVDALKAFFSTACTRTGAHCAVVTDGAGR